jgi:hypothetical protein
MRRFGYVGLAAMTLAAAACDLTDVTIADLTDIVVAEVYVTIGDTPNQNAVWAFIHGSAAGAEPSSATYDDAIVNVVDSTGVASVLSLTAASVCVASEPPTALGSCFAASVPVASAIEPGQRLSLDIVLGDGRRLTGTTRVPGAFAVSGVLPECRIPPDQLFPLAWTKSDSAWAYVSEALLLGLPAAFLREGILVEDSLSLTGLSISESDTTIVFPNEFGLFDRFDLDRDVALRLQQGLPPDTWADVAITATDRNYVNWVRGGSFNPSGTVRVSSVVGDGSGVFASAVTRRFRLYSSTSRSQAPACPGL